MLWKREASGTDIKDSDINTLQAKHKHLVSKPGKRRVRRGRGEGGIVVGEMRREGFSEVSLIRKMDRLRVSVGEDEKLTEEERERGREREMCK